MQAHARTLKTLVMKSTSLLHTSYQYYNKSCKQDKMDTRLDN